MKKKGKIIAVVALVIVIGVGSWFYGYYHRKSNDNIPSKDLMVSYYFEKGEDFATQKLEGYTQDQLKTVWGDSLGMLSGFFGEVWEADGAKIAVYYEVNETTGKVLVDQVRVSREE